MIENFYYLFLSWLDKEESTLQIGKRKIPCEYIIASVFPDEKTMDIALQTTND